MKKIILLALVLIFIFPLHGCNKTTADITAHHETVSVDYGKVISLAKEEFAKVFKELEDVQIEETATMSRTDDASKIVVQFKYSSRSSNGVYGFLFKLDNYANPELVQQGENITNDNLIQ